MADTILSRGEPRNQRENTDDHETETRKAPAAGAMSAAKKPLIRLVRGKPDQGKRTHTNRQPKGDYGRQLCQNGTSKT